MVKAFTVKPSALGTDSEMWAAWARDLTALSESLPLVGEMLDAASFSRVNRAQDVRRAYQALCAQLLQYLAEGAEEANNSSAKLIEVQGIYHDADVANRDDVLRF